MKNFFLFMLGVILMVTASAEQPHPKFLHTMIIFSDDKAAQKDFTLSAYKKQIESWIQVEQSD